MARTRWTTVALWVAGPGFVTMFAAGAFNAVALMPNWYADRPEGFATMRALLAGGPTDMRTFFVPVLLITLAATALAVVSGWSGRRRPWVLLVALALGGMIVLTLGWLLPLDPYLFQPADAGDVRDAADLGRAADRYVLLHLVRLAVMAVGAGIVLVAAHAPEHEHEG